MVKKKRTAFSKLKLFGAYGQLTAAIIIYPLIIFVLFKYLFTVENSLFSNFISIVLTLVLWSVAILVPSYFSYDYIKKYKKRII